MNKIKKGDLVTLSTDGVKSLENDRMSIYERVNLTRLQTNGGQVISLFEDYAKVGIFDQEKTEIVDHWVLENNRIAQIL